MTESGDYISRETVKQIIAAQCGECADACLEFDGIQPDCNQCLLDGVAKAIKTIPAADVRPVVRAQIIDMRYVEEDGEWKCSRCGWQYTLCVCGKDATSKIHFCPRCGADMRPTSMSGANWEES